MYRNIAELMEQANIRGVRLWEIVLENEMQYSSISREEIFRRLDARYEVMAASTTKALKKALPTPGNLISGAASLHQIYAEKEGGLTGSFINQVMARALSCSEVNASMGRICAAPTAGSCGIVPAVITSLAEREFLSRETVLQGLLTACGIGAIITANATVSGAEGGCQAECGVAAAMAAAAAVHMLDGDNDMAVHACSLALYNCMGLVCDPVGGLVQVPCAQRNASQAVNALISADLAMAGMKSLIPADEVVEAMYRVGKMLPLSLRETAGGGLAATPTARALSRSIFS